MANIYFIILPQVHVLDFAGPAHVFYEAGLLGCAYNLRYMSIADTTCSAQQLQFSNLELFYQTEIQENDIIFIPGISAAGFKDQEFLLKKREFNQWLVEQHEKGVMICGVCSGTYLLAQSGLLAHKECTTHWKLMPKLKHDFPHVKLVDNAIFVEDNKLITSAGVTSGIDLALNILEERHGPILAAEVAKEMIVYLRRNALSNQHSVYLQYRSHFNKDVHRVQSWIIRNIHASFSLSDLADVANMSERNLSRIFKKASGITITDFIMELRLERAKKLLYNPELSLSQVAEKCGLSERQLRRIWNAHEDNTLSSPRKMA